MISLECKYVHNFLLLKSFWSLSRVPDVIKRLSKVLVSVVTLCDPVDCSLPGSSVHGVLQAGIMEWVAIPFSGGSSQARDWTPVSCIEGRFFFFFFYHLSHQGFLAKFPGSFWLLSNPLFCHRISVCIFFLCLERFYTLSSPRSLPHGNFLTSMNIYSPYDKFFLLEFIAVSIL